MQHGRKWLPLGIIGLTGLLVTGGLVGHHPQKTRAGVLVPYYQSTKQGSVSLAKQTVQKGTSLKELLTVESLGERLQVNSSDIKSVSKTEAVASSSSSDAEERLKKSRSNLDNLQQEQNAKKPMQIAQVSQSVQAAQGGQASQTPQARQTPPTPVRPQASRGGNEVDRLVERALSLRGIPYKWGGTTRDGFDCSGFVQYVFKASGISLPRTSFEQYRVGTPVSRGQLQPGDLVFFSTYSEGPSDVRIYIGGGRTVGSSSGGVAVHSLSEVYWSNRYLGARRISL